MAKRKRQGGLWSKVKDAMLGKELPSGESITRANGHRQANKISSKWDNIDLDKPIHRNGRIIKTVGEYKDIEEKDFWDTLKGYDGS